MKPTYDECPGARQRATPRDDRDNDRFRHVSHAGVASDAIALTYVRAIFRSPPTVRCLAAMVVPVLGVIPEDQELAVRVTARDFAAVAGLDQDCPSAATNLGEACTGLHRLRPEYRYWWPNGEQDGYRFGHRIGLAWTSWTCFDPVAETAELILWDGILPFVPRIRKELEEIGTPDRLGTAFTPAPVVDVAMRYHGKTLPT